MAAPVLGLLSALVAATPAAPAPVHAVVVLSEDASIYRAASEAFATALSKTGQPIELQTTLLDAAPPPTEGRVVLALGTAAARRYAAAPAAGPRVFAVVGDPLAAGLTDRDGAPTTSMGGVSALVPARARLQLIRAAAPNVRVVGVVVGADRRAFEQLAVAAAEHQLTVVPIAVSAPEEMIGALRRTRFDALLALPDANIWTATSLKSAVVFMLAERRPLFGFSRAFTRAGALASVSAENYGAMGAQAAALLLAQLAGERARVVDASALVTSVNVVVANRLGLELPRSLTERAEDVFR